MKKLLRTLAAAFIGIGLSAGVAAAQTGTIGTTGPNSHNTVLHTGSQTSTVKSTNKANVDNDTDQSAYSGNAKVKNNTTGGDATSGDASNDSTTETNATLSNTGAAAAVAGATCGCGSNSGSINNTGPSSHNSIVFDQNHELTITSSNTVDVDNNTTQHASTGNASVTGNTTGGDATSGDASNVSHTSTTLNLSN